MGGDSINEGFSIKEAVIELDHKLDDTIKRLDSLKETLVMVPGIRREVDRLSELLAHEGTGIVPRVASLEFRLCEQIEACKERRAIENRLDTVRRGVRMNWWIALVGWISVILAALIGAWKASR